MKKKIIILVVLILVASGAFAVFYDKDVPVSPGTKTDSSSTLTPAVAINYDNLDDYMSRNAIINDLPEGSTILLKFYNFDSGVREWEKSFVVTRSKVYEGSVDNADLVVSLHSKYLAEWNSRNFCTIMTKANNNGDLGYETSMSTVSLAWKYKNLMKYKECFGE